MAGLDRATCSKCGRTRKISADFFLLKNGEPCDMCKDCLTSHIDNTNPSTFRWILEKFDVPYVEDKWVNIYNTQYKKNPSKMGPRSVLGRYLREMKLKQWLEYGYVDSDRLNFERSHGKPAQVPQLSEEEKIELEQKLANGEISQAEFDTLTSPAIEGLIQEQQTFMTDFSKKNEERIAEGLDEEDYQYLLLKWGENYRPSQWIKLEELYSKYEQEYELNADREDALRKICKVSVKIDEALDTGDIAAVDKLQRTYDTLRKSAKFTEAQNKEQQTRELDSIGELVAFVEKEGGAIPLFKEDPMAEYAQDKVDFCIKDMQNYINHLVREELGLSDLIESYIENLKNKKNDTVEDIMEKGFDEEEDSLTVEDVIAFEEFQADEITAQAEALLAEFGDA